MKVLVHIVTLEMSNVSLCELCLTVALMGSSPRLTHCPKKVTQHLDVHTVMMKWSLWT